MADFSQVPGLAGYQQQVALNDQQSMQGLTTLGSLIGLQKNQMELSAMRDKLEREKKIRDEMLALDVSQQTIPAASSAPGSGGAAREIAQRFYQEANIRQRHGDLEGAMRIREHAQKLMPELKDEQVRMGPEGRPIVVRNYKDGTTEVSPFAPADKLHFTDAGGVAGIGLDPYTGKPLTQGIAKTQTPDSLASNQVAIRGQNLADARAREANARPQFHEGTWVTPPTTLGPGQSMPVPGITKPMTEFQGKSAGYGARAAAAHEILNAVGDGGKVQPGYIKRAAESVPLAGDALGTLANVTQSPQQQQVEQAQRDFVNAVLRQESGAAISQSEFDNARKQYFPQPGDSPDVVLQKKRNREQAITGFAGSTSQVGVKQIQTAREKTQAIFEAHKAIKAGANKDAVLQRLEEMGVTDSGIR
jgi:predicted amino acid-binding ACT domain protein